MAKKRRVTVAEFEAQAAATDQLNPDDSETSLLGLVGEVGSLLSALKKKRRDTDAFFGYHEAVVEELGDVLWYISRVARHGGTSLAEALARVVGSTAEAEVLCFDDLGVSDNADQRAFEVSLLRLAGEAGDLAKRFAEGAYRHNVDALRGDLVKLLRPLMRAANAEAVSLEEAALHNMD
jgi:NTP pyrophosphatase (non-canonical NTP hydrolase)